MPPRKRVKAAAASTPSSDAQQKPPQENDEVIEPLGQPSPDDDDRLNDPWTDDQETQLFKSMIRWKPTGLHKHFRMICIHNNMRSLGFATEDAQHTRIPGVWRKLSQLYDLHALDEREVAYAFQDSPDPLDPDEAYNIPDFELPEDEFGELMWHRRFHGPGSAVSSSPPFIPIEEDKALYHPGIGLLRDLPEGAKSQRAESNSATIATPKSTRNKKTTKAAAAKTGKVTRSGRKAQPAQSESAEEEEEEGEEEEEEEIAESEAETAPSTRRTNRSGARAKPVPKRTRKR
ncbi:CT20-domain-containing protein [Westerdykella ornata]|uniref:CT20-domain-containing protein n=1 Tax=Westerdykella ornata TaxID=318751 RepID=A0A6A6JTW7_WESOR|nr:CT20-domain-containing protein [Westerdykella ornata]KAF2279176.1 CT20-domain-containing protein [Westerdykella ornata]